MKLLTIAMLFWGMIMGDHQFKRELRVPHYDCGGQEVIADSTGLYNLEWMIRNRLTDPGFETWSEGYLSHWDITPDVDDADEDEVRSGVYCLKISGWSNENISIGSDGDDRFIDMHEGIQAGFGITGSIYIKQFNLTSGGTRQLVISFYDTNRETIGGISQDIDTITGEYALKRVIVQPEDIPAGTYYVSFGLYFNVTPAGDSEIYMDDAALHFYNPHLLMSADDFAALNVEDEETFTFGDDYDTTDSGGALLRPSTPYGADDTMVLFFLANGSAEATTIRPSRDIWNLVFRLFSKSQVLKLRQFYKAVRGLPFTWVDDCGREREVLWTGGFNPRPEGAHDTFTIEINLTENEVTEGI